MTSVSPAAARHLEIRLGVSTRPPRVADGGTAPVPETLIVERWRRLASRHGVTDLLLYRARNGRAIDFRFVEVKRATERVSAEQVAEIELLRSLGLQAGIVRLDAQPGRIPAATPRSRQQSGRKPKAVAPKR